MATMLRSVALVALGSVLLVACGGGDGGGGASSVASVGSPVGGGSMFDAATCARAGAAVAAAFSAVPAAMSGSSTDLQSSIDQMQAFAAEAPDEIKDDLNTVAQGYADFQQAVADSGYDPSSGQPPSSEAMAAIQAAGAKFDDPDFKAASDRLTAWFNSNCGG